MFQQLEELIPKDGAIALTLSRSSTPGHVRLTIVPVAGEGNEGKPRFHPLVFDDVNPAELDAPDISLTPVVEAVKSIKEVIDDAAKTTVAESGGVKKTITTKASGKTHIKYEKPEKKEPPTPPTDATAPVTPAEPAEPAAPVETAKERKQREAREKEAAEAEATAKAKAEQEAKDKESAASGVDALKQQLAAADDMDLFAGVGA